MPLSILLPLVVGGIAGIVVLLHLLGLSTRARLTDPATAGAAWDREFDDDRAHQITLCRDGHAALIETRSGRRGIVFPMGADTAARYLDGAELHETAAGLRIDLPDFTAPHINLTLTQDEAARWPALMKGSA